MGQKFQSRALKFPGLISGCTMDWFTPWPNEALVAVSNYFLTDFNMVCSADVKAAVVTTMGAYHDKVSVTCESYFERYKTQITFFFTLLHCNYLMFLVILYCMYYC